MSIQSLSVPSQAIALLFLYVLGGCGAPAAQEVPEVSSEETSFHSVQEASYTWEGRTLDVSLAFDDNGDFWLDTHYDGNETSARMELTSAEVSAPVGQAQASGNAWLDFFTEVDPGLLDVAQASLLGGAGNLSDFEQMQLDLFSSGLNYADGAPPPTTLVFVCDGCTWCNEGCDDHGVVTCWGCTLVSVE